MNRRERSALWRDIHGMKKNGMREAKIVETLNATGSLTQTGKPWDRSKLANFYHYNRVKGVGRKVAGANTTTRSYTRRRKAKSSEPTTTKVLATVHEPVDVAQFNEFVEASKALDKVMSFVNKYLSK